MRKKLIEKLIKSLTDFGYDDITEDDLFNDFFINQFAGSLVKQNLTGDNVPVELKDLYNELEEASHKLTN